MKVSIIIPVFNGASKISKCLTSILHQSYPIFEAIIINDGSTDETLTLLTKFADSDQRIRIINKSNEGVSAARNDGIRNATGKWITFCDADDEVEPDWLKSMVEGIGTSDFLASGINFIKPNGVKYSQVLPNVSETNIPTPTSLLEKLIQNNVFGFVWCKLFKRNIIIKNQIFFDTQISFREDELWCVNYFKYISSWKIISYVGYNYYLPPPKKNYKGCFYDFSIPIFAEYDQIYQERYPQIIVDAYYKLIRNIIVTQLTSNNKINSRYISIFKKILHSDKSKRSKLSIITNWALVNNYLTRLLIKPIIKLNQTLDKEN